MRHCRIGCLAVAGETVVAVGDTLSVSGETAVDGRSAAQSCRTLPLKSTAPGPAELPHGEVVAYETACMRTHCPEVCRQPR